MPAGDRQDRVWRFCLFVRSTRNNPVRRIRRLEIDAGGGDGSASALVLLLPAPPLLPSSSSSLWLHFTVATKARSSRCSQGRLAIIWFVMLRSHRLLSLSLSRSFSLSLSLAHFSLRNFAVRIRQVEPAGSREVSRRGLRRRALLQVCTRLLLVVALDSVAISHLSQQYVFTRHTDNRAGHTCLVGLRSARTSFQPHSELNSYKLPQVLLKRGSRYREIRGIKFIVRVGRRPTDVIDKVRSRTRGSVRGESRRKSPISRRQLVKSECSLESFHLSRVRTQNGRFAIDPERLNRPHRGENTDRCSLIRIDRARRAPSSRSIVLRASFVSDCLQASRHHHGET